MEKVKVNVVVEPILGPEKSINFSLFHKRVKRVVTLPSSVLVKNICKKIMTTMGCGDLSDYAQAVIFLPRSKSNNYDELLSNSKVTMGNVKSIIGEPINIRISAKSRNGLPDEIETEKSIYSNLIKLLIKEIPDIKNVLGDSTVKNAIEAVNNNTISELSYESISQIHKTIENKLISSTSTESNYNTVEGEVCTVIGMREQMFSYPTSWKNTIETKYSEESCLLNSFTSPGKSKVKRNRFLTKFRNIFSHHVNFRRSENVFLDFWYLQDKNPSLFKCEEYAKCLNTFSKRSPKSLINGHLVKDWFDKKNEKEHLGGHYLQANQTY
ncbi:Hypothetical protein SRAE_1000041700 [Strongyloides ratti]|uniref:Uncharacterized protein n=1 Tax=Strongyloides ratti TaxID=34506 RepID=A0A090MUC3_STRRB|nr:Hypothetical protein SRAE_1000041700 [Strongyloides ratti]CEF62143.1 Hypothetical protein SRAE_1000041700 [Strongyloides ratti]